MIRSVGVFLVIISSAAECDDFLPMTPLGEQCLPVSIFVEGDRDLITAVKDQLAFDINFSGLLEISDEGYVDVEVEISRITDGLQLIAKVSSEEEEFFRKSYFSVSDDIYPLVHALADDLVFTLTGEQGIASTRIGFVHRSGSEYYLMSSGLDPRSPSILLYDTHVITTPAWSPDGSTIAFTSFRSDNADLYFYSLSSGNIRKVSSRTGLNTTPAWSLDGSCIALTISDGIDPNICLLNPETGSMQTLTRRTSIETSPSFSPSGQQIVFTSDRFGSPQLFIMDNTGAAVSRLSYAHSYCDSPAWSPAGDRIAYAARTSNGSIHIFVMNHDGLEVRQVTFDGYLNEDPVWSPTGRHLAFSSNNAGTRSIYAVELNKLTIYKVTDVGESYCAIWSPI